MFFCHFKLIEHLKVIESSISQLNPFKSSEHLVIKTLLFPIIFISRYNIIPKLEHTVLFNSVPNGSILFNIN